MALSSASCQFGVEESEAEEAARCVAALPSLALRGIHVSTESNVLDVDRLLRRADFAVDAAERLRGRGLDLGVVDLGGGFGVPGTVGQPPLDHIAYGAGLAAIARRHPHLSFIHELGRFLVAESGAYVVTVTDVKRSGGRTFVLVDGGINHLYRPRLTPQLMPPIRVSGIRCGEPCGPVTIAGPLCDSADIIAEDVTLPAVRTGDRLAVVSCGAYGYGHGLLGFSLYPTPAEAIWDGEQLHLVRHRGTPSDVLRGQCLPGATTRAAGEADER
jgi:diaminopimelate decarboxylase